MTSFDVFESSKESSQPVELFQFIKGSDEFRYTSGEDELTVGGDVYTPIAIARNQIVQGSDQANRNLIVTMPTTVSLAQEFIDRPPGEKVTVNVYRLQRPEVPTFDTQVLLFKGTVQSVRYPNDGTSAEFAIRSIESALNGNIPRFTFMGMCNHILYDNNCGVNASSFDLLGACTLVSGDEITITGVNASGIDFVGGYVRPTGENDFRMVLAQSGDVLTLLLPFQNDPTGTNMQAFAGCDHVLTGDCALVFDNVAEFGGFHFVPSKDIFAQGLQ